ncbi:type II toxin-antitoxin system prevent-host-death family antitoxin [candidate division KSB1 bacterium]|nr:type II toxin-antitoxin system prevent-host-death family antitoxin [candidate division KSB1 bacterium]
MQFVNIRELSRATSKYVKIANEEDEVIVTRNGHPYALLQKIDGDELEDFIIAKHLNLNNDYETAQGEHQNGKTINARELLNQIEKE